VRTTIIQITDTHLVAGGAPAYGRVDTLAGLRRAVDHILAQRRFIGAVDAVVATGDLTDHGEPEAYALFREALAPLGCPVYAIPGNHDRREPMRRALAPDGLIAAAGSLDFAADVGGLTLIGLDTLVEGQPHGAVSAEQCAWLDSRLAQAGDRPVILFLHHPPFVTGVDFMDAARLRDDSALAQVVAGRDCVRLVSCGHVHRCVHTTWAGRPAMVAPAPSHSVALSLAPGVAPHFTIEPGAVVAHHLTPGGALTSHVSPFGAEEVTFPF
jgi:3',5'-cyclic AMP phosphodiesterase CpdA